ncbi:glycosyltransferase [Actinokineospora sp. G85]|uniref:glycosyltransferase n=1 Tax=Actinokineospora sp. G85 TaxID=3406626 RepID=UPI003C790C61
MLNGVEVVVPAHDEAENITACLNALAAAVRSSPVPVRVTVIADTCTDPTADLARAAGARVVEIAARNVGAARAAGFALAEPHARWFATTDADSLVPPTWFADQLAVGADLVAGAIEVLDWSDWPQHLPARFHSRYSRGDEHVHGTNLGITSAAYAAIGGFAALVDGEDVDLVDRAKTAGLTVVHTRTAPVTTSGRRVGRCPAGFAGHLRALTS